MALVDRNVVSNNKAPDVHVVGKRLAAHIAEEAPWDPAGKRMRG